MQAVTGAQVTQQTVQGILSRIDALAAKIGTTAGNVYNVYVAEARVEGLRDFVLGGSMVLAGLGLCYGGYRLIKHALKLDATGTRYDSANTGGYYGSSVPVFLASALLLQLGISMIYAAIPAWFNSQYWAFQHLTIDLKNLL